jgi:hypothetical protein
MLDSRALFIIFKLSFRPKYSEVEESGFFLSFRACRGISIQILRQAQDDRDPSTSFHLASARGRTGRMTEIPRQARDDRYAGRMTH